jgi:hypothetical protein
VGAESDGFAKGSATTISLGNAVIFAGDSPIGSGFSHWTISKGGRALKVVKGRTRF